MRSLRISLRRPYKQILEFEFQWKPVFILLIIVCTFNRSFCAPILWIAWPIEGQCRLAQSFSFRRTQDRCHCFQVYKMRLGNNQFTLCWLRVFTVVSMCSDDWYSLQNVSCISQISTTFPAYRFLLGPSVAFVHIATTGYRTRFQTID